MEQYNPEPYSRDLLNALMNNDLKDVIRVKGGCLLVTIINDVEPMDCDHDDCLEFAEFLVLFINGSGENDLQANLCSVCLLKHIDHAKTHPAYVTH